MIFIPMHKINKGSQESMDTKQAPVFAAAAANEEFRRLAKI